MADPLTDPFDALRAPVRPTDPDPAFATRLRARVVRALALPRGVAVSATTLPPETATVADTDTTSSAAPAAADAADASAGAAVPYLAVRDARRALDWYAEVLGARLRGEPIAMPDGRVGHAELELAGGLLYLADEHPEIGVVAPRPGEAAVSLMLAVPDADVTLGRAVAAGARQDREPYDGYGQRNAWLVDPFGHRWGLHSPLATAAATVAATAATAAATAAAPQPVAGAAAYRHGDVGYVWLSVPDVERATDFYRAVLGWDFAPGSGPGSWRIVGTSEEMGLSAGPRATLSCCYAVDDIGAAVGRVRAAGGRAEEPTRRPYGPAADCVDDQGTVFALFESPADATGARPAANGVRQGDLAYLTLEVVDSAAARAFYGAVLGWQLSPGRIDDGWQVADVVPMTGLSGGHPEATGVPMWRVDDIAATVNRVRAAGGTATEPQRQPYGLTSECEDDQGTRFYLGEM